MDQVGLHGGALPTATRSLASGGCGSQTAAFAAGGNSGH